MVKRPSMTAPQTEFERTGREPGGSQTLLRGLDVLNVVAQGVIGLSDLSARLGLTKSTTHRLASALVEQRYLIFTLREGYGLGPKLLELGYQARQQMDIPRAARPHLEHLSALSQDTVHLGVLEGDRALYLDKITGSRRINIGSRVGERHPLASTGLGKALLLDGNHEDWRRRVAAEVGSDDKTWKTWVERMERYVSQGHAFDLEENEPGIRCVAAPIRDASGGIVAAISCSSAAQYMDDDRLTRLAEDVKRAAEAISLELGWGQAAPAPAPVKPKARRASA
jgi:DNA-binding IclR family transcriptional regulator